MAYEQRNNNGSLFKNDRKQNDRQPDLTGTAIINGKTWRVSAWKKTSRDGSKTFLSLEFNEPTQAYAPQNNPRGMQQTGQMPSTPVNNDMPAFGGADDDLGF